MNPAVAKVEVCPPLEVMPRAQTYSNTLSYFLFNFKVNRKGKACKMDTDDKSRTRKKNEDRALQRLGEQLVALPFGQLETMELPDELLTAVAFARKIKNHGARRRQIQYIGALMRHIDPQPIETALDRIRTGNLRK